MSQKYTGGFITKSPVAPTTTAASGIWTLDQQQQAQKAGTWPSPPIFIEDLFSTYLYTGNGGTQTITNGIDLSTKGGLVWTKSRTDAYNNALYDTVRGVNNRLFSNTTGAVNTASDTLTAFNTNGFTLGANDGGNFGSGSSAVSWTFREQPKFFDIVTYTGNGTASQVINHNLGSVPGCIITKSTSNTRAWWTYHRSTSDGVMALNSTAAKDTAYAYAYFGNNTVLVPPTSTQFTIGFDSGMNTASETYVAYLFAHDAGGFPVSGGGSTNGISCGSYTGTGSPLNVELGYEPQWVLVKKTSATGDWILMDTMRGMSMTTSQWLYPNTSGIEDASGTQLNPTATGFTVTSTGSGLNGGGATYIYIAIRRGPMKTPTVGTSVFANSFGTATSPWFDTGFPVDASLWSERSGTTAASKGRFMSRFQAGNYMTTNSTTAESALTANNSWAFMDGWFVNTGVNTDFISWNFRRAPGFFDEVCYTGTLANLTLTHNLGVAPEMMIVKCRSSDMPGGIAANWAVYAAPQGNSKFALLNTTDLFGTSAVLWQATTPTASNFYVGAANYVNGSGQTYVAYLFASVAGVSKVGTYTGTGALLTVDCGFTSGARFVLIKRADTSGDWYVYDSTRGLTSGNDPYLLLNTAGAEVTGTNYVDTDTTGFQVTAAAPAGLNANGGTYIFLAIA